MEEKNYGKRLYWDSKKIVQNPNQIEEILAMLESKMELNPLIKELNYARRFQEIFLEMRLIVQNIFQIYLVLWI